MSNIDKFKQECKEQIEQQVTSSDFEKLKWYIDYNGGFSSDLIPLQRIVFNADKILEALKSKRQISDSVKESKE